MKKGFRILLLIVAASTLLVAHAQATNFTAGNLAILRVGDGSAALVNSGGPIFVDEYTTGGALQQSVAITSTGAAGLQISGTATSEGALSLSADRQHLVLGGYNPGASGFGGTGSLSGRSAANAPRAYGYLDPTGLYTFGGTFNPSNSATNYSTQNIRGVTQSGSNFYGAGSALGTILEPTDIAVQTSIANTRVVNIQNGNLYLSTSSGTQGIYGFSGAPTSASALSPIITGVTGQGTSPFDFAFSPSGTTAYVADSSAGVQRFDFNGSAWSLTRTFTTTTAGLSGLAVDFTTNTIYAVNPGNLWSASDPGTGTMVAMTSIATAGTNTAFRGLEFTPVAVPEPASGVLLGLGLIGTIVAARKRRS